MPNQVQNPNTNLQDRGLTPVTTGIDPVMPPAPVPSAPPEPGLGQDPAASNPAAVEPVPLPKVTDVEKPVEPAAPGAEREGLEEPHPLFEKPVTAAPGGKDEGKGKKEEGQMPKTGGHKLSKTLVAGIAGLVFLVVGGLVGGSYLVKQKQDVTTLAEGEPCDRPHNEGEGCAASSGCDQSEPGWGCASGLYCFYAESGDVCREIGHIIQGSANAKVLRLNGNEVSNLSCGQEYIINSGISVTLDTDYGQIWDHRIWINHQGDNSGKERGLIHWTSDGSDLSGDKIQCECGNEGQCRGGGGYASLESGGDYIELTRCTAWTNGATGDDLLGPPNHGVNFFFKPKNQWGTDGPTTDNDISVFGKSTFERHNWANSDLNFNINCAAEPTPTPTRTPTPTPTRALTPTPTPTPVVTAAHCGSLVGQVSNGSGGWTSKTDAEFVAAARPGDRVRFMCTGVKSSGNFTKAAFFINDILHVDDVVKLNATQFAVEYTISGGGQLKVGSVLLHDSQGWVD